MMQIKKYMLLILLMVMMSWVTGFGQLPENQLKAAFIEKFTHFIEWPDDTVQNKPFVIYVFPDSPLIPYLQNLFQNHKIKQRPVDLLITDNISLLDSAHIVIVHSSYKHIMPIILARIKHKAILTIGDYNEFLNDGGILLLYREEDTLRFAINLDALSHTGLIVSSQLLKLAKLYR